MSSDVYLVLIFDTSPKDFDTPYLHMWNDKNNWSKRFNPFKTTTLYPIPKPVFFHPIGV